MESRSARDSSLVPRFHSRGMRVSRGREINGNPTRREAACQHLLQEQNYISFVARHWSHSPEISLQRYQDGGRQPTTLPPPDGDCPACRRKVYRAFQATTVGAECKQLPRGGDRCGRRADCARPGSKGARACPLTVTMFQENVGSVSPLRRCRPSNLLIQRPLVLGAVQTWKFARGFHNAKSTKLEAVPKHLFQRIYSCYISSVAQPPGDTSKSTGRDPDDLGPWAGVERRDTWDILWAADDPSQVRNPNVQPRLE